MKKIGIFLDEITDSGISEGEKLSKLGGNTGNMLFWESLKANLNLEVIPRRYINYPQKLDLGSFSAFVTTDLIWIRQMQDFSYLNRVLDAIGELPLIPISIGLQCDHMLPDFRLHPETVKVIGRISERCVMGVRGEYTAEILRRHGIGNFMVIGCPSMYMDPAGLLSVGTEKKPVKRVSANFETFYKKLDKPRTDFLRYCAENELSFAEQTAAEISEKQIENPLLLKNVKGWLKNNSHIFFDINEWRSYIRELDFSIGARFHGNVIALWENVPALFLVTDSRTKELCEHFSLPHMNISDFDRSKPLEYYYELADYSEFHKNYPKRLAEWKEFLKVNGLENQKKTVVYQVGHFGFLINCILHKLCFHKDEAAVFLLDKVIANDITVDNFSRCKDNFGYIGKFYFYNDKEVISEIASSGSAENAISAYFDRFTAEIGLDLSAADEIYSIFDTYNSFGVYLNIKQLAFNMIEGVAGQCRDHKRYNLNKGIFPAYDDAIFRYKALSSDSAFCRRLYAYGEGEPTENIIYGNSPSELLQRLSAEERDRLVSAYGIDFRYSADKEYSVYILSSEWWSLDRKRQTGSLSPRELYFYGNQTVADLFINSENVIIKLHPNSDFDRQTLSKAFPGAEIIPGFFPSFLMGSIPGLKIRETVSTGSSGAKTVSADDNRVPFLFFDSLRIANRLYAAVELAKHLGVLREKFFHYGIHNSVIWRMEREIFGCEFSSAWSMLDFPEGSVTIFDNIFWNPGDFLNRLLNKMRDIRNNAVIVFLNSAKDFIFLNDSCEFLPFIYELRLEKKPLRMDTFEDLNEEVVYIFCRDPEKARQISDLRIKKVNKYRGFELFAEGISMDRKSTYNSIKTDYLFEKAMMERIK